MFIHQLKSIGNGRAYWHAQEDQDIEQYFYQRTFQQTIQSVRECISESLAGKFKNWAVKY